MKNWEENPFTETGIWNVGQGFSFDVIMYHIYWLDRYETMVEHGAIDINQDIFITEDERTENKIKALRWYYTHLYNLVSTCKFAIRGKSDKKNIETCQINLKKLDNFIPKTYHKNINQATGYISLSLDEKLFKVVFEKIRKLKEEILPILYRANLIYHYVEDIDPKEHKKIMMLKASGQWED